MIPLASLLGIGIMSLGLWAGIIAVGMVTYDYIMEPKSDPITINDIPYPGVKGVLNPGQNSGNISPISPGEPPVTEPVSTPDPLGPQMPTPPTIFGEVPTVKPEPVVIEEPPFKEDPIVDFPQQLLPFGKPTPNEPDPNEKPKKEGGRDPLVVGEWYYHEVATRNCESNRSFDFDNDYMPENFCYEIIGNIFVIDWDDGEGITHGYNMLNFDNTQYEGYTPERFLRENPDICNQYDCYLWNDSIRNWNVDDGELTEYDLKIIQWNDYLKGSKIKMKAGGPDRYIYGIGTTHDNQDIFALMPTYWTVLEK